MLRKIIVAIFCLLSICQSYAVSPKIVEYDNPFCPFGGRLIAVYDDHLDFKGGVLTQKILKQLFCGVGDRMSTTTSRAAMAGGELMPRPLFIVEDPLGMKERIPEFHINDREALEEALTVDESEGDKVIGLSFITDLTARCKGQGFDAISVEFRQASSWFMSQDEDLANRITREQLKDEYETVVKEIESYRDTDQLNGYYAKVISKFKDKNAKILAALHDPSVPISTVRKIMKEVATPQGDDPESEEQIEYDSELVNACMMHALYQNRTRETIVLVFGGWHLQHTENLVKELGFRELQRQEVDGQFLVGSEARFIQISASQINLDTFFEKSKTLRRARCSNPAMIAAMEKTFSSAPSAPAGPCAAPHPAAAPRPAVHGHAAPASAAAAMAALLRPAGYEGQAGAGYVPTVEEAAHAHVAGLAVPIRQGFRISRGFLLRQGFVDQALLRPAGYEGRAGAGYVPTAEEAGRAASCVAGATKDPEEDIVVGIGAAGPGGAAGSRASKRHGPSSPDGGATEKTGKRGRQ